MNQPSDSVEKEKVNDPYLKANHGLWDAWTRLHFESRSETYDLEQFKVGVTTLQEIELQELGNDVAGKSLLHLQCHFGLDTVISFRFGRRAEGTVWRSGAPLSSLMIDPATGSYYSEMTHEERPDAKWIFGFVERHLDTLC